MGQGRLVIFVARVRAVLLLDLLYRQLHLLQDLDSDTIASGLGLPVEDVDRIIGRIGPIESPKPIPLAAEKHPEALGIAGFDRPCRRDVEVLFDLFEKLHPVQADGVLDHPVVIHDQHLVVGEDHA